jgi:phage tail tape-measure protein
MAVSGRGPTSLNKLGPPAPMKLPISQKSLRNAVIGALTASSLMLVSCQTPGQSAAAGALGGAALGAVIGNQSGEAGKGALIGGALGGAGGYGVGKVQENDRRTQYRQPYQQNAPYQGPAAYPSQNAPYQ